MVLKILKSGKKIRDIARGLENDAELDKYIEKREVRQGKHVLHEDIEVLGKYVDYLRFSRPASLFYDSPSVKNHGSPEKIPIKGKTKFPLAFVSDVLANPERWSGHHVIIDGSLQFVSTNDNGEHWHRFSDGTGTVIAVGSEMLHGKSGTLFGVARQTSTGKQLFLEIKNFHTI